MRLNFKTVKTSKKAPTETNEYFIYKKWGLFDYEMTFCGIFAYVRTVRKHPKISVFAVLVTFQSCFGDIHYIKNLVQNEDLGQRPTRKRSVIIALPVNW